MPLGVNADILHERDFLQAACKTLWMKYPNVQAFSEWRWYLLRFPADAQQRSDEEYEEKKFGRAMMLREELFEECERAEVLDIVDIEKGE